MLNVFECKTTPSLIHFLLIYVFMNVKTRFGETEFRKYLVLVMDQTCDVVHLNISKFEERIS